MDPGSVFGAVVSAVLRHAWREADSRVDALAKERGVPKQVVWAEIQAYQLERARDPRGWRAAAQAFEQASATAAPGSSDEDDSRTALRDEDDDKGLERPPMTAELGPPTGKCFCGCGQATKPNRYFVQTHDRAAEAAVIRRHYGGIAAFVAAHGYGPDSPAVTRE